MTVHPSGPTWPGVPPPPHEPLPVPPAGAPLPPPSAGAVAPPPAGWPVPPLPPLFGAPAPLVTLTLRHPAYAELPASLNARTRYANDPFPHWSRNEVVLAPTDIVPLANAGFRSITKPD